MNKTVVIIIVIVGLLLVGGVGFTFFQNSNKSGTQQAVEAHEDGAKHVEGDTHIDESKPHEDVTPHAGNSTHEDGTKHVEGDTHTNTTPGADRVPAAVEDN